MIKKLLRGVLHADWGVTHPQEADILAQFYKAIDLNSFPESIAPFTIKRNGGYYLGNSYLLLISDVCVAEIYSYAGCEYIELTEQGKTVRSEILFEMKRIVGEQKEQDEARNLRAAQKIKEALTA